MPTEKAKNLFLGKEGRRVNCAQAVLIAFQEKLKIKDLLIDSAKKYGAGRAPEGYCGAYWSALEIIKKYCCPEKAQELEDYFLKEAGSLQCREIRASRKLSCLNCITKAAEYLKEETEKD